MRCNVLTEMNTYNIRVREHRKTIFYTRRNDDNGHGKNITKLAKNN